MKKNRETEQLPLATEEGEILARLSDRVGKAIGTIQELRRERDTLKARLSEAESRIKDHGDSADRLSSLEENCSRFKSERDEIRTRIETMLANLEALDTAAE